jgi:hypothetical protein
MPSISQAQASLGRNFDLGGQGKSKNLALDNVEAVMVAYANAFIEKAKATIEKKKKIDRGNMSDIHPGKLKNNGTEYTLTIGYEESNPASKYYDYQNKGVKGTKTGPNSKYQFTGEKVKPSMIYAIMQWYLRHPNYIKNEDQRKGLTQTQLKRKSISKIVSKQKSLWALATKTSKNIKERGLKRIGFFDDNLDVFGTEYKKELAQALGTDVVISIREQFKNNGNNNNK